MLDEVGHTGVEGLRFPAVVPDVVGPCRVDLVGDRLLEDVGLQDARDDVAHPFHTGACGSVCSECQKVCLAARQNERPWGRGHLGDFAKEFFLPCEVAQRGPGKDLQP